MTDEPRDKPADDQSPETTQLPPPATDPSARAYSQAPGGGEHTGDDFVPVGSTASFGSPSEAFGATPSGQSGALPPAGPPTGPLVAKTTPQRHTGKIIGLVSVVVVLVLVIAGVSSEMYLRHKVKGCVAESVSSFTGTDANVSISAKPMLLQWVSGSIPFVQVDTKDNANSATKLHLRLDDLSRDGDNSKVGSIDGNGSLAFDRILELSKKGGLNASMSGTTEGTSTTGDTSAGNGAISNIAGDAAAGTIKVDAAVTVAFFQIPVTVTVKPEVVDGKVSLKVTSATAVSFGIPSDFAQGIVDQMTQSMFASMFDTVKFTSIKVTDTGVDYAVAGKDVTLKQNVSNPSGSCSALF